MFGKVNVRTGNLKFNVVTKIPKKQLNAEIQKSKIKDEKWSNNPIKAKIVR